MEEDLFPDLYPILEENKEEETDTFEELEQDVEGWKGLFIFFIICLLVYFVFLVGKANLYRVFPGMGRLAVFTDLRKTKWGQI